MKMEPARQHYSFIFEGFLKTNGILIVLLVIAIVKRDVSALTEYGAVLGIALVGPVSRIISYCCTFISLQDDKLIIDSGWLRKSHKELPISGIATVNLTQNLFHQLLGAYRLVIDNAGSIGEDNEVCVTFGRDQALELKEMLTPDSDLIDGANVTSVSQDAGCAEQRIYKAPALNLLIYGALGSKWAAILAVIGAVSAILQISGDTISRLLGISFEDVIEKSFGISDDAPVIWGALILGIAIWLIYIFIFSVAAGALGALIRYFDYTVTDTGREIHIHYGLIVKKSYKFDKSKISGFSYEQPIMMRLLGLGMLKCIAVGYGMGDSDATKEDPMMLPLVKASELSEAMSSFTPEVQIDGEAIRPEIKNAYYFLYRPMFVIATLALIPFIILGRSADAAFYWVGAVFWLICAASTVMQFRNSSVTCGSRSVCISNGGFIKHSHFIKADAIESISETASLPKLRKGVAHVEVCYFAKGGRATALNISTETTARLQSLVEY